MRILREQAVALIIDVQERLFPHMEGREALEHSLLTLIRGLRVLEVPLLVTQQYTKGLGATIPAVREALGWEAPVEAPRRETATSPAVGRTPWIEKQSFSCCDEPQFSTALAAAGRKHVIVAGIEAHVCVLQTVIDLAAGGQTPVLVADCVSSRRAVDRDLALRRLQAEGAVVTTCESILFELTRLSGTETFKAVSRLVK